MGENQFGGEAVTYEGIGATKKWERLESYGPKFVENIVQATARDILVYSMQTLRNCSIVAHVHDELIIEADPRMSLEAVCEQMGRVPAWADGLLLRADGYECSFYNLKFIRFLVNEEEMQLVVQSYHKKDFKSHRVPTRRLSDRWEMEISSNPLCMLLANKLDWDLNRSYRVPGRILPKQQIAIFDLKSAEIIDRLTP